MAIKFLKTTTNKHGVLTSKFYRNDRRYNKKNAFENIEKIYMDYINQGLECSLMLDYGYKKVSSMFSTTELKFSQNYDDRVDLFESKIISFIIKIKT